MIYFECVILNYEYSYKLSLIIYFMTQRILAVVGMSGSGKGEVTTYLENFHNYSRVYFGGVTLDKLNDAGLEVNEENERKMRENLRVEYGMAVYAKLSLPKIQKYLEEGKNTVIDGLYSWEELKFLRESIKDLGVIAVVASRKIRYERLSKRPTRPLTLEQAISRDNSQIENLNQGGPISYADHYIQNEFSIPELHNSINKILGIKRRPSWDNYFMNIARIISSRGTCDRKYVGAVIVDPEHQILTTGYNGSISGQPHCSQVGHEIINNHCERTIHAEENALLQAGRVGASLKGGTIYSTASPCWKCFRGIVRVGLKRIVFGEMYRDERITNNAKDCSIELIDFDKLSFDKLWEVD